MPCTSDPYRLLTVISGPSGVGKATVTKYVREMLPELCLSVSDTTRPPRPGEVNGTNYNFISEGEFRQRIASGHYLEYASYGGNLYGTPKRAVLDILAGGVPMLVEIEVQGAEEIRKTYPAALMIFLLPVSWEVLEQQLDDRMTDSDANRAARKARAREEVQLANRYGHRVVNYPGDPLRAAEMIAGLIRSRWPAERLAPGLFPALV